MESVEMTKCEVQNSERWYLCDLKRSTAVEVGFNNGQHYKYAGDKTSEIGDLFVVGPGAKSSYALGRVISVANSTGKTGRLAGAVMSFRRNPGKSEIKKCYDGIKTIKTVEDIKNLFPNIDYAYKISPQELIITDILTSNVLRAVTILAFLENAPNYAIDLAKSYLSEEKTIPDIMFGSSMNKIYDGGFMQLAFSGYYPGWQEELQALSVWKEEGVLSEKEENYLYEEDGLLIYEFNGNNKIKTIFKNNSDFNKFINKMIYMSAFGVMIRGGMLNLLETALCVQMPIKEFYDEIIELAKKLDVPECIKILESVDYKSLVFAPKTKEKGKNTGGRSAKTVTNTVISAGKEFRIDGSALEAYKGNDEIVVIPEGIKTIEKSAFRSGTIKKIVLSESVTQIKTEAFANCHNLEVIEADQNLASVGNRAFSGCEKIKSVDLEKTKIKTINRGTFEYCLSLSEIVLPKSLVKIDAYAFAGLELDRIVIPATVETIDLKAFHYTTVNQIVFEGDQLDDIRFLIVLDDTPEVYCNKNGNIWKAISKRNEEVDEYNKMNPGFSRRFAAVLVEL